MLRPSSLRPSIRIAFLATLSTLGLTAALSWVQTAHADQPAHAHWAYRGPHDAAHWAEIDPDFKGCKTGHQQSPIDIRHAIRADLPPLEWDYRASTATVINNGHTLQVNLSQAGALLLDGERFELQQFHFHTPSEERVNGRSHPLEAHLVHRNASGELAVLAVFIDQGAANAGLQAVFDHLPAKAGETQALASPLQVSDWLPASRRYYRYRGSLTTPPCSEGVRWQVLQQPITASAQQIRAFQRLYPFNARPIQPLHDRKIEAN